MAGRGADPVPSTTVRFRISSDAGCGRDCAIISGAQITNAASITNGRRIMTKSYRRRTFLKGAAAVAAGTMIAPRSVWAAENGATKIDPTFLITPKQAWDWHAFKSAGGPTYAGSAGWKRYTDFLLARLPESGAVDLDSVDIPYDHYIVDDWPDRRTHLHDSGMALEKLVSGDKPVPVVASY